MYDPIASEVELRWLISQNLDLLEPHNLVPSGVFTLDGMLRYGEEHKQCPYFSVRRMVNAVCYLPLLARLISVDAILQRYHLFIPLSPGPQDCRKSLEGAFQGLYCGI